MKTFICSWLILLKFQMDVLSTVLSPDVRMVIKLDDSPEHTCKDLQLTSFNCIKASLSDSSQNYKNGAKFKSDKGSHWSVLVWFIGVTLLLFIITTIKGLNSEHGELLATRLHLCLAPPSMALNIVEVECAQQTGAVEFGAFFLHNIEIVCKIIMGNTSLGSKILQRL